MKTEQQIRDVMAWAEKAKSLVKTVVKNKKERILAETMYESKISTLNWVLEGEKPKDQNFHICQADKVVYFGSRCPICLGNNFVPKLTHEMIKPNLKNEVVK
jgi:hypothetical protein